MYTSRRGLLAVVLLGVATLANAGPVRAVLGQGATAGAFLSSIVAGKFHVCELIGDGGVRCWGGNPDGQLGNGTSSNDAQTTPVQVTGLSDALALAAGSSHTCALRAGGTVSCWGDNTSGRLGDGTSTTRLTPVAVSGLTGAVAITAGEAHTCALLANGTVRCWGSGGSGQLGNSSAATSLSPVVVSALSNVASLAAGQSHTCALLANGTASCWGYNAEGELGTGSKGVQRNSPVAVAGLSNVAALAAAYRHTCALRVDGTIHCWGFNDMGQLGRGSVVSSPTPVAVSGISTAVAIEAGGGSFASGTSDTCALLSDGSVRCWGGNAAGQLGDGTTTTRSTPVPVSNLSNAVALAAGNFFTCALQATGGTVCWGGNFSGQLGDGSTTSSLVPTASQQIRSISAVALAAGGVHNCALRGDGAVACWGLNNYGQLAIPTSIYSSSAPVAVPLIPSDTLALTAAKGYFTCALRANGTVRCWGANGSGQLGRGGAATDGSSTPAPVVGLSSATALAAGGSHACAIVAGGGIFCWGDNVSRQLGDGTANSMATTGVVVNSVDNAVEIVAGGVHTCVRRADGTVSCWGANNLGQVGDGTSGNHRPTPVPVNSLFNVVALAAGHHHTCALRSDGTVRCWGTNFSGQIGNGTISSTTPVSTPALVAGITSAVAITAATDTSCALLADGTARCWGGNTYGQVGDGTTTSPRLSPVPVTREAIFCNAFTHQCATTILNLGGLVSIDAGSENVCALQFNGAPYCWGRNNLGQVGDGTLVTPRARALEVSSFRFNIAPAVALRSPGRVATVTAILNCPEDQQAKVEITLRQGSAVGHGIGMRKCAGGIDRYEFTVPAKGPESFVAGPAEAHAEAVVLDHGTPVETQNWTRKVTVSVAP